MIVIDSILEPIAKAFDRQSETFDEIERSNESLRWMRAIIHRHMEEIIRPGQKLLDINAGTGIDAIFFAEQGVKVHAMDISAGMLEHLQKKILNKGLHGLITPEQRSFTSLEHLPDGGFDHVFSNFGGLNCISDPEMVIGKFSKLLKPGGIVTLVVMPPICPWEVATVLRGNFRMAFRRLRRNAYANIEGVKFTVHYFTPRRLIKAFGTEYARLGLRGLCSIAPPPCFEKFPLQHPTLYRSLSSTDEVVSRYMPFNSCADHYILSMQYRP